MKKLLIFLTLFFVLTPLSTTSFAAQDVAIKGQVSPPQAERGIIKTNWNVIVRWRTSVAGVGRWEERRFTLGPDGFYLFPFVRPGKSGIELQAIITIQGWPLYQDSAINLYWEGGAAEPDVYVSRNAEVQRIGVDGDTVVYGALFIMK